LIAGVVVLGFVLWWKFYSSPLPAYCRKDANVILISIDTLRADHLHCYGYARETSPVLDQMARESILFENAIVQSPWTMPSHASMLTSLYPAELGLGRYPKPGRIGEDAITLAEILSKHGYTSVAFTDGGWVHSRHGFGQGFEIYNDEGGHFLEIIPRVMSWLREHRREKFFMFIHTYDVHTYSPLQEYIDLFFPGYEGHIKTGRKLMALIQHGYDMMFLRSLRPKDLEYIVSLYDAEIRYVDDRLGEILRFLERKGLLGKTFVIIVADHGEEFLEHGGTGHGYTNYDEQLRVPFIIRHPNPSFQNVRVKEQVRLVDLLPTILDLVDVREELDIRGMSLTGFFDGGGPSLPAFTECGHRFFKSLRKDNKWKLIYDARARSVELLNLEEDPRETRNVYGREKEIAGQMTRELQQVLVDIRVVVQPSPTPPMSEEQREKLRALGYLE